MRLHVDLGRGRKEVVDVTPASTIADVLSECCRRHSLDAAEHALKQAGSTKTILDDSLTIRFSGLTPDGHAT